MNTRQIFLAGASAGGHYAFAEARRHPESYAGLLLISPAISGYPEGGFGTPDFLQIPTWLTVGTDDGFITQVSSSLALDLRRHGLRHEFRLVEGGDHGTPLQTIDWAEALSFLLGNPPRETGAAANQ